MKHAKKILIKLCPKIFLSLFGQKFSFVGFLWVKKWKKTNGKIEENSGKNPKKFMILRAKINRKIEENSGKNLNKFRFLRLYTCMATQHLKNPNV